MRVETISEDEACAERRGIEIAVFRACKGDAEAFDEVAVAFAPVLYRWFRARGALDEDARDAVQETLLAAWKGISRVRDPARFKGWLFAIAARRMADHHRSKQRAARPVTSYAATDESREPGILEAISTLEQSHQEVLLLRFLVGLSEVEVADALGIQVGTVKSRTSRARVELVRVMEAG